MPLQSIVPAGHWQVPPWQVWPPLHAVHEAPQCIESLDVSAHAVPQSTWGDEHAQTPAWQVWPPVQACPQLPQFALSVCKLVQELPQRFGAADVGHWQRPAWHTCAEGHAVVHAPQWAESFVRSEQVPLQSISPEAHELEHA